jgi:hypothetical protein
MKRSVANGSFASECGNLPSNYLKIRPFPVARLEEFLLSRGKRNWYEIVGTGPH